MILCQSFRRNTYDFDILVLDWYLLTNSYELQSYDCFTRNNIMIHSSNLEQEFYIIINYFEFEDVRNK